MRMVGCVAGYNEEDMLPYSIGAVYDELDSIIFVEGAIRNRFDTPNSTDNTIEVVKSLDKDNKITIVQKPGGDYWDTLEEQKSQFEKIVKPGEFMVIFDADEVYREGDLTKLRKIIEARPNYTDIIPIFLEYYGDLKHVHRPTPNTVNLTNQRILKWRDGFTFSLHHPTASDSIGLDTVLDVRYAPQRIVIPDLFIHHLSWCRPMEFLVGKHSYYYQKFDGNLPAIARKRAEDYVANSGKDLLYYDGPLPKVLENHPLNTDTIGSNFKNWRSSPEYYDTTTIPIVYNIGYVSPPSFSVVITCYNNLDILKLTLHKWKDVLYNNFEVIVVEDGAPEGITQEDTGIKDYVESLGYIYKYNDSGSSYDIVGARNIGIGTATNDRVLLFDSDMIPDPNIIMEQALLAKNNNITVGIRNHIKKEDATGSIEDIKSKVYKLDGRLGDTFSRIEKGSCFDSWESCWGCSVSYPRDILIKLGGLDQDYSGNWGAEDIDIAYRAIKSKLVVKPAPKSIGYHIDHPSLEREGQRKLLNSKMSSGIITINKPKSWG